MENMDVERVEEMHKDERFLVAELMKKAGYSNVEPEMVNKIKNKYGFLVYAAVVGDAMVVYTPEWSNHHNGGFVFISF